MSVDYPFLQLGKFHALWNVLQIESGTVLTVRNIYEGEK